MFWSGFHAPLVCVIIMRRFKKNKARRLWTALGFMIYMFFWKDESPLIMEKQPKRANKCIGCAECKLRALLKPQPMKLATPQITFFQKSRAIKTQFSSNYQKCGISSHCFDLIGNRTNFASSGFSSSPIINRVWSNFLLDGLPWNNAIARNRSDCSILPRILTILFVWRLITLIPRIHGTRRKLLDSSNTMFALNTSLLFRNSFSTAILLPKSILSIWSAFSLLDPCANWYISRLSSNPLNILQVAIRNTRSFPSSAVQANNSPFGETKIQKM